MGVDRQAAGEADAADQQRRLEKEGPRNAAATDGARPKHRPELVGVEDEQLRAEGAAAGHPGAAATAGHRQDSRVERTDADSRAAAAADARLRPDGAAASSVARGAVATATVRR